MARLGGTCVNVGCVPKKVMYNAATHLDMLHHTSDYGIDLELKGFSWKKLKDNRDAYIRRLNDIYARNVDKSGIEKFTGRVRVARVYTLRHSSSSKMSLNQNLSHLALRPRLLTSRQSR